MNCFNCKHCRCPDAYLCCDAEEKMRSLEQLNLGELEALAASCKDFEEDEGFRRLRDPLHKRKEALADMRKALFDALKEGEE